MKDKRLLILMKGVILPIFSYFVVTIISAILITIIGQIFSITDSTNVIIIMGIAALIYFIIFYFSRYEKFLSQLGYKEKKFDLSKLKIILPLSFGSTIFFNILLLNYIPFTQNNAMVNEISENIYNTNIIISTISISIIVPLAEELMMRGYVYNSLRKVFNYNFAIIVSALIFGIIHGNITQGIYAFFLGVLMAIIYKYYKNLIYCFIFHISANFFVLFLGFKFNTFSLDSNLFILFVSFFIFAFSIYRMYLDVKK